MKNILPAFIFVPIFLFAQKESQEFVVKKKETSTIMYYSRELIKAPEFTNYLWIVGKKICFYSSKQTPTPEYNQTNVEVMLADSFKCHSYTTTKDSIKFIVNSRFLQPNPDTYRLFYTFYSSGVNKMLRLDINYPTTPITLGPGYKYTEFIPIKKE